MEPVITIFMCNDFTTDGWTEQEVKWLLENMDWSVQVREGGFIINFYIPVTN
jgi:hypothetical protein